jgi:DNA-binding XRE family transcriptional regulator
MVNNERLYTLIGERVRQIRETQTPRMSQEELGRVLDLKRTSVTNIEQGNQKPTLDAIYRLCERFGLQIHEVLPAVAEVTRAEGLSVTVAGESHNVGAKTASVVARLRPSDRSRR